MTERLLQLTPHIRSRLIRALDTGLLTPMSSPANVRAVLGIQDEANDIAEALAEWHRLGIPGPACSAWVRSLEATTAQLPVADLVWSGPEVPGIHSRDTRRVYEELLGTAERSIWASSYAYFDGPKAFQVLAQRMDSTPQLRVVLLLNIQRKRGDQSSAQELVSQFAQRFWMTDWPGKARPAVYYDPRSLEPDGPTSVLHAKAVVADEETVFITSANLTEAALDRNIEMGLLMRDRALALSAISHFRGLIDRKMLLLLPDA